LPDDSSALSVKPGEESKQQSERKAIKPATETKKQKVEGVNLLLVSVSDP